MHLLRFCTKIYMTLIQRRLGQESPKQVKEKFSREEWLYVSSTPFQLTCVVFYRRTAVAKNNDAAHAHRPCKRRRAVPFCPVNALRMPIYKSQHKVVRTCRQVNSHLGCADARRSCQPASMPEPFLSLNPTASKLLRVFSCQVSQLCGLDSTLLATCGFNPHRESCSRMPRRRVGQLPSET